MSALTSQKMEGGLTQAELMRVMSYDMETGHFTRLVKSKVSSVGDVCGYVMQTGYRLIGIGGRSYTAHRLAFLYVTGEFPTEQVDHINRNRSDNRWKNIRPASNLDNSRNKKRLSRNTSGATGVSFIKANQKWRATIGVKYKEIYLGYYETFDEALIARKSAERQYGFSDTHGVG